MSQISIHPCGPLDAVVSPPGSKSLTNRALLIAALASGTTTLDGALDSEDTQMMLGALRTLRLVVQHDPARRRMTVEGRGGGFPVEDADLYVGNSGTTARFLTAALALAPGKKSYRIHGKPRMHERPIRDLIGALKMLGANLRSENRNGCPPLLIGESLYGQVDWNTPGSEGRPIVATVAGDVSSQFLSALMMAAPLISKDNDIVLKINGTLVSRPYVEMTAKIMESFGVETWFFAPEGDTGGTITIPLGSVYQPRLYTIEPDASAASYFFAAAAVCGGRITVAGLTENSLQGDVRFVECLRQMGCSVVYTNDGITVRRDTAIPLQGVTVDMNAISDTVQTLAVVALFAEGPTRITNVAHIRHKETDRIHAAAVELRKIGAIVEEFDDGLLVHPPTAGNHAEIETYDDHRMAMSFAIAGLREPGITIKDPQCVEKTYPEFFNDLAKINTGTGQAPRLTN